MGREIVMESWFSSLWWNSRKGTSETEKAVIGILAFEVAGLMSKVVSLWNSLTNKEVVRLREEILYSIGIQKLVAENDDDYLMDLALDEIIANFGYLARSVARLGKRCTDPIYHRFQCFLDDPVSNNFEWCGWEYRWKKMEKKVKKMERFIAMTMQLTQELEVLAEQEQTLRRMQRNESDRVKLLEFRQKVMLQRQEVRNLREMSPWIRSYDYIVRLLVRSLFTILERVKHVFAVNQMASGQEKIDCEPKSSDLLSRSQSFSLVLQPSVHASENNVRSCSSGPLSRSVSKSGLTSDKNKTNSKHRRHQSVILHGKRPSKHLVNVGSFAGCMMGGSDSPIVESCKPISSSSMRISSVNSKNIDKMEDSKGSISCGTRIYSKLSMLNSKKLLAAPPCSLGAAALALHYANVIILIEKLAPYPHMIGLDARDDLYNMLPTTIRTALRTKLKPYAKSLGSSVYDASLAAEWSLALVRMLKWLAPLAHNTIKWHSEHNFEQQNVVLGPNVLLVQTLHFANWAKTEAAIMELLVGLNYLSRIGKEHSEKALVKPGSTGN